MKNIQPTQTAKKSFDTTYIRYGLTALIIFGSPFLPPIDPITPMGMAVLGTFLGAVYGWSTLNMLWPSILGLIGLGLAVGMPAVLGASFGTPIIAMLFMMFVVIALLNETQATEAIASFFTQNKLTLGRPWYCLCCDEWPNYVAF